MLRVFLCILILCVGFPVAAYAQQTQSQSLQSFMRDSVTIETQAGQSHSFGVELALTPRQQAQGLMFREFMPADAGMLFLFAGEAPRRFWMKNTLIPLDIIFIRADGTIHHIHESAQPHDLSGAPSNGPVAAVLEINGGLSNTLKLAAGDRIIHPVFNTQNDK